MKQILVFGNGGPAAVLVDYLRELSAQEGWMLNVMSDVETSPAIRREHITHADVVISLAPDYLQRTVAEDCIELQRHLISPAPLQPKIMKLRQRIDAANILCLYEMGFDPGLDHMSALQFTVKYINKVEKLYRCTHTAAACRRRRTMITPGTAK